LTKRAAKNFEKAAYVGSVEILLRLRVINANPVKNAMWLSSEAIDGGSRESGRSNPGISFAGNGQRFETPQLSPLCG